MTIEEPAVNEMRDESHENSADSGTSDESEGWTSSDEEEEASREQIPTPANVSLVPQMVCEAQTMPTDVKFHRDGTAFLSSDMDGHVTIWTLSNDRSVATLSHDFLPHRTACRAVTYMKSTDLIVSVGKDKRICTIDGTSISRTIKKAHGASIYSLHSLNENTLATGDDDGNFWDLRSSQSTMEFKENSEYISALTSDDAGRTLLATCGDGTLSAYNVRSKKLELQSEAFSSELLSVTVIKNGSKVICGSGDGNLLIFNWGEWGFTLDQYPTGESVSIDAIEKFTLHTVLTANSDGYIRLINVMPYRQVGTVGYHSMPFEHVSYCSALSLVASTSHDNVIRFWSTRNFNELPGGEAESDSGSDEEEEKQSNKRAKKSAKMPKRVKPSGSDFFNDL